MSDIDRDIAALDKDLGECPVWERVREAARSAETLRQELAVLTEQRDRETEARRDAVVRAEQATSRAAAMEERLRALIGQAEYLYDLAKRKVVLRDGFLRALSEARSVLSPQQAQEPAAKEGEPR